MYKELKEKFVEQGASIDVIDSVFSIKRYGEAAFQEYLLKRLKRAVPQDVDKWLKHSTRHAYIAYTKSNGNVFVNGRNTITKKKKIVSSKKKLKKQEIEQTMELKKKFDALPKLKKKRYFDIVKQKDQNILDFLIPNKAFLLFCEDQ